MKNIFVYKAVGDFVNKDYLTDCVKDLMTYYKTRDFIQMAFAYDEIHLCKGLKMFGNKTFFTEVLDKIK